MNALSTKKLHKMEKESIHLKIPPVLREKLDNYVDEQKGLYGYDRSELICDLIRLKLQEAGKLD